MISRHYFYKTVIFLLLFLQASCSFKGEPEIVMVSSEASSQVCHVVILPFIDESNDPGIASLSSRVFRNELINDGVFTVESEGAIRRFLTQKKLLASDMMDTRTSIYRELSERLSADAVIRGTILNSGLERTGKDGDIPYISLKVELVAARTGQLLVDTFHQRRGDDYRKLMHVGVVRTKTGLMVNVAQEIIDKWKKKGVVTCQP